MARTIKMNNKPPAKARKSAAKSIPNEREAPVVEDDEFWREAKPKAEKKKEETAAKRAEAAAKRAEARRLAELEETILEKSLRKVSRKVTEAERRRIKEEEEVKKVEEMKKRESRTVPEKEYESMVVVENRNRQASMVDARSLEEALAQLAVFKREVDRYPERRVKAALKVRTTRVPSVYC